MRFGLLSFIFGTSCRVGYGYSARDSGPWAVRVVKKSARAISKSSTIQWDDLSEIRDLFEVPLKLLRGYEEDRGLRFENH